MDCRTRGERGVEDLKPGERRIGKSRYASISSYLSKCATKFEYNDIDLPINEATYERLKAEGIDELMSRHIAHLFIRDTVSLFRCSSVFLSNDLSQECGQIMSLQ